MRRGAFLIAGALACTAVTADGQGPVRRAVRNRLDGYSASLEAQARTDARGLAIANNQIGLTDTLRFTAGSGYWYPGDPYIPVWGAPLVSSVPQAVGRVEEQVSPTRWVSRPVYAQPNAPRPWAVIQPRAAAVPVDANGNPLDPRFVQPNPDRSPLPALDADANTLQGVAEDVGAPAEDRTLDDPALQDPALQDPIEWNGVMRAPAEDVAPEMDDADEADDGAREF